VILLLFMWSSVMYRSQPLYSWLSEKAMSFLFAVAHSIDGFLERFGWASVLWLIGSHFPQRNASCNLTAFR
jgi:hypothetical protein